MPEDEDTFVAEKPSCYIVIGGDPINGFNYFGPFDNVDAAEEFGSEQVPTEWWVGKVYEA